MSKRLQQTSKDDGESLLREWGVGDEVAALRAAWGRDPRADAAIVERLARQDQADAVAALAAFEKTADKAVRKEIRRALFRLEQRGLEVPHEQTAPTVAVIGAPDIEGYMSASDGNGDQLLWLVKSRRGELLQLFAVINDPDGMRETELHPITRKILRAAREDLLAKHEIQVVEVDWRYCDYRIHQAYRWAMERGAAVRGDYLGLRNQILHEPPVEVVHPIRVAFDAAAIRADESLLTGSGALCEEKELRTWFLPAEAVGRFLEEIEQAQNSPLLLNDHLKRERVEQILERAVEEIFGGEGRATYQRCLLDLAHVLRMTQRPTAAKQAFAVSLALEGATRGGAGIPFCEALVRLSIGAHIQAAAEQQKERARESLIVTPQEVARSTTRPGPR